MMISAVLWVPKGVAKANPIRRELPSKEEIEKLNESCEYYSENDEEEEENSEAAHAKSVAKEFGKSSKSKNASSSMELDEVAEGLKELNMDNYDEEDDEIEIFSSGRGDLYYASNEMDPYLKNKNDGYEDDSDDDPTILPTDSMIVCAMNENCAKDDPGTNYLDVYVCEEATNGSPNTYSHHNIIVPEIPLCIAWLDCPLKGGEKVVGLFNTPIIEICDLDVMDDELPCVQLGGKNEEGNYKEGSHTDSVMGLAWNKEFRNILASASADKRVKVWDMTTGICNITMEHHTNKVQAVAWNHYAPEVLLSGSFDQTVVLKDVRKPSHSGFKWSVMSDVESLAWDPHSEHSFVVSLEDGTVKGFDVRQASNSVSDLQPSFTLHAHDKTVTSVSYNISAPNLLATGSVDKTVKLWDLSNNEPSCIATHKPKAGPLSSIAFSTDNHFLLAIGGFMGKLIVWDTLSDTNVSRIYGSSRVRP